MPILASQLMAAYPSTEEEQIQFVDLARSVGERLSQQLESVASLMKAHSEPRYVPSPFTPPPLQRRLSTIVINLTIDLPLQE